MTFSSVSVSVEGGVGSLVLNRPSKSNALNKELWTEIPQALTALVAMDARAIVLSGAGKNFCAGIDLDSLTGELQAPAGSGEAACDGRRRAAFRAFVLQLQAAMSAFEECPVPVVAAIHGSCIGAGIDMVTACDIRLATADATFSVKEADLAIVADMGTLQRLPSIVGHGVAAELALTARSFSGTEARELRLVSRALPDRGALLAEARALAAGIAAKSPLAVTGTKRMLLYQRDHSVQDGLDYVATWNSAQLPQSADLREVFAARAEGRRPRFRPLSRL